MSESNIDKRKYLKLNHYRLPFYIPYLMKINDQHCLVRLKYLSNIESYIGYNDSDANYYILSEHDVRNRIIGVDRRILMVLIDRYTGDNIRVYTASRDRLRNFRKLSNGQFSANTNSDGYLWDVDGTPIGHSNEIAQCDFRMATNERKEGVYFKALNNNLPLKELQEIDPVTFKRAKPNQVITDGEKALVTALKTTGKLLSVG